ncbi:MAG TPA: dTMP kinase [bacterium]
MFVTLEGIEGAGKTTQAALLAEALRARGVRVVVTREPGGTAFGAALRGMLLDPAAGGIAPQAELFLYLADRAQHVRDVIAPGLAAGACVVCDRFADATVAYQGYGRGLDAAFIAEASAVAAAGVAPDLTVLLDCEDVASGVKRAMHRQAADGTAGVADRFEREELGFHRRVRDGYRALAAAAPGRFRVLPATLPVAELQRRILAEVEALRGGGEGQGAR